MRARDCLEDFVHGVDFVNRLAQVSEKREHHRDIDVRCNKVTLHVSHDRALDLDLLRRAIRPTTRLIAVDFPNNPTGYVPDAATCRELVELCDERGVKLNEAADFCDEEDSGLGGPFLDAAGRA